jgi:hypothetical protein
MEPPEKGRIQQIPGPPCDGYLLDEVDDLPRLSQHIQCRSATLARESGSMQ